ncbi:replication protein RepA [Acetobacter vaccinii]|uniref:Plasmid replication protein n=1 Tax=Acetobacter vaccinii TaxID=2592655 RepID=A0A5C1YSZ3_9PROT|nr:replication protein RepA [Acetobacter vaccinii]QEO18963.1 plasmid replication protein [Acetobacter vaccinii]
MDTSIPHPDLFVSMHELVEEHGSQKALEIVDHFSSGRDITSPPTVYDALAGRAGRKIVDTVSSSLVREAEGISEIGYSYSAWCLAGLPHRERKPGEDWLIKTDYAQLLVRPGVRLRDDDSREDLSVPSGSIARLLLIDWQSEAFEHNSREINLGKSPAALLNRLGLSRGGPVTKKLVEQIERLATCTVDFRFGTDREAVVVNERLVEAFKYVGEVDPRTKRTTRMIEKIVLSEAFYNELKRHPILVDRAAIRDIQTSPRAIDAYLWLAFRLHALQSEALVSWAALWRQFGREFKTLRSFKAEFQEPLALALAAYRAAKVRISEKGLYLSPSPPPIQR